ncbi:flagellar motor protein PomA [Granulosicoccus antarcticus]|uniref:Chemotaxis protein PomA n=1 Tax=Granulosicoccus antarcticus IMCC3135 TaxID=1192854 RepID=A0A2Z2NSS9_9GAMM|nr:flagellar motor protein PomA [Granulosicoccus antarcticus]ASJ71790.1 Chemotaxis protein PomA [Granulosicoccus antarcticus IMCC3135]
MDIATLLGLFGALAVIMSSIFLGGSVSTFVNVPSIVVVVGGTFMVSLCQISLSQFFGSFKVTLRAFMHKSISPEALIEEAVTLADVARKEGILALEGHDITDPFLENGVKMCIDGHSIEIVQKMLSKDINLELQRQNTGVQMFKSIAEAAPAMGMIGTLIGLVQMLANMDDPKSIGPAMAVALLTTLYGAIIANAIALPIAAKLKAISSDERLNKLLVLESVSGIQEGVNPRVLQQLLTAYLPESKREAALSK